ncbi:hypothetical protein L3X38_021338 [Prunus dulcis]|uniref:Uncharacterized protein n=1 Tax=Prunus dulcis TaxID=3755 RepID=A0AAD4VVS3_PRUDU|nr:hypothetical protein L3X38_021338 [Prunus dulcis]
MTRELLLVQCIVSLQCSPCVLDEAEVINDVTTLRQQLRMFLPSDLPGLVEPALPGLFCTVGNCILGLGLPLPELESAVEMLLGPGKES